MLSSITCSYVQFIIGSKCHCTSRMMTMRGRNIIQNYNRVYSYIFFICKSNDSIYRITIIIECGIIQVYK